MTVSGSLTITTRQKRNTLWLDPATNVEAEAWKMIVSIPEVCASQPCASYVPNSINCIGYEHALGLPREKQLTSYSTRAHAVASVASENSTGFLAKSLLNCDIACE